MENFVFALNATMPVFLIILLGWFLKRVQLLNDAFCKVANQYVFKVALPVSLFLSIATMDFASDFNAGFCLFCFGATVVMFLGVWAISWRVLKNKTYIGAFAQASVRSSAAILGIAFATNIYGSSGMVPMMIMAAVPFFNVFAVLILTFSPTADTASAAPKNGAALVRKAVINVLKNPIIIGILLGLPFSFFSIPLPTMLHSALNSIGGTASPVALLVVGASFSGGEAMTRWKPAAWASTIKLVLLPLVFLPLAVLCGFRQSELVAILIMVGFPTTDAAYVMARSMHQDGVLTSNTIVLTTLFSSVTITLWLFLLRTFALI